MDRDWPTGRNVSAAEEADRQDVPQESPQEFLSGKDVRLQPVAVTTVAVVVTHLALLVIRRSKPSLLAQLNNRFRSSAVN